MRYFSPWGYFRLVWEVKWRFSSWPWTSRPKMDHKAKSVETEHWLYSSSSIHTHQWASGCNGKGNTNSMKEVQWSSIRNKTRVLQCKTLLSLRISDQFWCHRYRNAFCSIFNVLLWCFRSVPRSSQYLMERQANQRFTHFHCHFACHFRCWLLILRRFLVFGFAFV